jgi:hypothetical protein
VAVVVAEVRFKMNERRNEAVNLGKLVPEIEQGIALVDSNDALKIILGEVGLVCVSQNKA